MTAEQELTHRQPLTNIHKQILFKLLTIFVRIEIVFVLAAINSG